MAGDEFIAALSAAITPRTIVYTYGDKDGVKFVLSDGASVLAKRSRIKTLKDADEMAEYIKQVIG